MAGADANLLDYAVPPAHARRSRVRSLVLAGLLGSYPAGMAVAALTFYAGELSLASALAAAAMSPVWVPTVIVILGLIDTLWYPS